MLDMNSKLQNVLDINPHFTDLQILRPSWHAGSMFEVLKNYERDCSFSSFNLLYKLQVLNTDQRILCFDYASTKRISFLIFQIHQNVKYTCFGNRLNIRFQIFQSMFIKDCLISSDQRRCLVMVFSTSVYYDRRLLFQWISDLLRNVTI